VKGYDNPGDSGYLDVANAASQWRAEVGAKSPSSFAAGPGSSGGQTLTLIGPSFTFGGSPVRLWQLRFARPRMSSWPAAPGSLSTRSHGLHLQRVQFFDGITRRLRSRTSLAASLSIPRNPASGGLARTNAPGFGECHWPPSYWTAGSQSGGAGSA